MAGEADEAEQQGRMTFAEHLEELRKRLLWSAVAFGIAFILSFSFYEPLIKIVTWPYARALRMLGRPEAAFLAGSFTGPIFAVLKLCFITGLFAASPVVGYQLWKFVGAGLYRKERRWALVYMPFSIALFMGGCLFGYCVLIPYGLYAMAAMFDPSIVAPTYLFSDYLNLVMLLTVVTGGVFELPLVMMFVSRIGLVRPEAYGQWRKFAIVGIVFAAAILTPSPDPFTQMLLAVPMWILYEIGVLLSKLTVRKG